MLLLPLKDSQGHPRGLNEAQRVGPNTHFGDRTRFLTQGPLAREFLRLQDGLAGCDEAAGGLEAAVRRIKELDLFPRWVGPTRKDHLGWRGGGATVPRRAP
jgi:hypothetical protein